jgi:hypothetical protein
VASKIQNFALARNLTDSHAVQPGPILHSTVNALHRHPCSLLARCVPNAAEHSSTISCGLRRNILNKEKREEKDRKNGGRNKEGRNEKSTDVIATGPCKRFNDTVTKKTVRMNLWILQPVLLWQRKQISLHLTKGGVHFQIPLAGVERHQQARPATHPTTRSTIINTY